MGDIHLPIVFINKVYFYPDIFRHKSKYGGIKTKQWKGLFHLSFYCLQAFFELQVYI